MANEVKTKSSSMLVMANDIITKLQNYGKATNLTYSEYGMKCVDSMFTKINDILLDNGLTWEHFKTSEQGVNNIFSAIKFVANLELNVANNEVALTLRNKDINGVKVPMLEYKIQGVGNDKIIRRFGNNVKDVKSYIVYEGDEFTLPYVDGFNYVLPKFNPKFKSQKALYAVYLIKLENGDIDVSIGSREDVKVSVLAHIEDSNRFDTKYTKELKQKLENATLDELISGEFADYNMSNDKFGKPSKLIKNKAYTGANRERMIERKLRNWALRKWSHNLDFGRIEYQKSFEETFEDEERYNQQKDKGIVIEHNQQEFVEKSGSVEVGVIEDKGKDVGETVVVKQETQEPVLVEVPIIETPKELIEDDDLSWTKD